MQRIILATMFALVVGGGAAFSQMHSLPPEHVDSYAGEVILRAGVSGGMNYAGVYLVPQRRWFVYQSEELVAIQEVRTTARIEYWHTGFRVTLPAEKRALIFRRADARVPPDLRRSPFTATSYTNGYGIVHVQLPRPRAQNDGGITTQDYCSPEFHSCGPFDQDPVGGGGGGPAPCTPAACSVNCASGTCEAACGSGYKAICKCNESTLTATCYCSRC